MKGIIFSILVILILCTRVVAQQNDFMKMIDKKEFSEIKPLLKEVYKQDTNVADYYDIMYHYYINQYNEDRDSLFAYFYLIEYNKLAKKKIETYSLAKSVLANIYKTKSIERFDFYIVLTANFPELNNEAKRIRNQLAYDDLQEEPTIDRYKHFVQSYPDAPQVEDAWLWLNEHLLQYYVEQGNIDSLKYFAANTTSDIYKSKIFTEIDRLSFSKALKENTIDAYVKYIKEFPQGDYLRMARTNIEKAKYEQYVLEGNITDMLYYLDNNTTDDKNYEEVFNKLSLLAMEHYSLIAMQKIQQLRPNEKLLKHFVKKYISDLDLHTINMLIETFPELTDDNDVITAKSQAEILEGLRKKTKLTLEDYKRNKILFRSLNAHTAAKIFETFEDLNSVQPKSKVLNFGLNNDVSYIQLKNARSTDMNFVLTEKINNTIQEDRDVRIFAKVDTNGYGYFEGSTNRDIFVSLFKNGVWSKPIVLPSMINSRYDESNPILSSDKKTLFFSSDRGFNFGKKDIYIAVREDVNDWDCWSEPILLSEDLNTKDNDYILQVTPRGVAVSQDDNFNAENTIYLEGNTMFDIVKGNLVSKDILSFTSVKINIYDKQTLELKNVIHPNEKGFFAFLKYEDDVVMSCKLHKYFSPLSQDIPLLYSIEQMVLKQELITIHSPFDENGNITNIGKKNLELLAENFKNTPYVLTIGVHAVKPIQKMDENSLSDKQAMEIIGILVKNGMDKENIIAKGYGRDNLMQGWETVNSIDIGVMQK
ncbi:MAG: hypothetical protein ACTTJH_06790 [Bacteroidales bacterium]